MASNFYPVTVVDNEPVRRERKGVLKTIKSFSSLYTVSEDEEADDGAGLTSQENDLKAEYPHGFKLVMIILSGVLPYVVTVLDDTVVATIIPVLIGEFHEPADIGWYASAYFLPLTVLMPVYGKAYTLWKIRWTFLFALFILTIGSVISAAAKSSTAFITGRAIAGSGAAGIVTGAMRIIMIAVSREKRTFLEGFGAVIMGLCSMSGPILGGAIADTIGWRWSFWINAPIAGFSVVIVFTIFPKENTKSAIFQLPLGQKIKRLDPIGAILLVGALTCLITALQTASVDGWLIVKVLVLFSLSGTLTVLFILHESYTSFHISLIPRKLLLLRTVWSCSLALFFLFASFINFIFFLSIFFQAVHGLSPMKSSLRLLPYIISTSIGATITAAGVAKVRYYNPFFIVGGVMFSVGAGFLHTISSDTPTGRWIAFQIILGFGQGLAVLANVAPGQTVLAEKYHSLANGFTFLCSMLGAAISVPISSTIFNDLFKKQTLNLAIPPEIKLAVLQDPARVRHFVPPQFIDPVVAAMVDSLQKVFLFGVGMAVAGAISLYMLPWKPLLQTSEEPNEKSVRPSMTPRPLSVGPGQFGAVFDLPNRSSRIPERPPRPSENLKRNQTTPTRMSHVTFDDIELPSRRSLDMPSKGYSPF